MLLLFGKITYVAMIGKNMQACCYLRQFSKYVVIICKGVNVRCYFVPFLQVRTKE